MALVARLILWNASSRVAALFGLGLETLELTQTISTSTVASDLECFADFWSPVLACEKRLFRHGFAGPLGPGHANCTEWLGAQHGMQSAAYSSERLG